MTPLEKIAFFTKRAADATLQNFEEFRVLNPSVTCADIDSTSTGLIVSAGESFTMCVVQHKDRAKDNQILEPVISMKALEDVQFLEKFLYFSETELKVFECLPEALFFREWIRTLQSSWANVYNFYQILVERGFELNSLVIRQHIRQDLGAQDDTLVVEADISGLKQGIRFDMKTRGDSAMFFETLEYFHGKPPSSGVSFMGPVFDTNNVAKVEAAIHDWLNEREKLYTF